MQEINVSRRVAFGANAVEKVAKICEEIGINQLQIFSGRTVTKEITEKMLEELPDELEDEVSDKEMGFLTRFLNTVVERYNKFRGFDADENDTRLEKTEIHAVFKNKDRNLSQDALIKTAELYAILEVMEDRDMFNFIERDFMVGVKSRIVWIFRQILINYRINYKDFLQFENDNDSNRFFKVDPTGKVTINQKVYNIPKHYKDKGMYPDLGNGTWIKEFDNKE